MRRWFRVVLVSLLGVAAILESASAASIVGSYHDLSWINAKHVGYSWPVFDDYNEVCVYCHTPHHANQAAGPLWNRATDTNTFTLYASPTLDTLPDQPGSSSRLCLSCHDGTVAVDAILNAPPPDADDEWSTLHGKMVIPWGQTHADCSFCHRGNTTFGDFTGSFLGTALNDEHPVGIAYTAAPDLMEAPGNGLFPNGIKLVGGKVECASCHNVHDPGIRPFLRTSNAGSALCYTCHKK